ncbi:CRISPR-associated ring nuclease Csm6 [Shewanella sp. AC91-MNA-CIBAN-0169]|uniref:CRISPR-associated ring nuclease Csm6 n=1 Tax=Shewanella sp. AC91-MNA-CIBAN-0169 TaxID=3140466 RepID=UPI003319B885
MKNILLAITGASPQVVTETLYALHIEGKTFPDEVIVITTSGSKAMLMEGFFTNGHLKAMQQEYDMSHFIFDESNILLIEDEQGDPIEDAKSIEDQTYMANYITRKVFELTKDENIAIHASIAGGRKTMAFYLGYAMSLLGRPQDSLSHVFVNDEFEFVKDFYYPTKATNWIVGKQGNGKVDTSQAQVTLAEIPFVRMRQAVDPQLINSMGKMSFSQTVATLNSIHNQCVVVDVYLKNKTLSVSGVDIKLTAKELAFYIWLITLTQGIDRGLLVSSDERVFKHNFDNAIGFLTQYLVIGSDSRVFNKTFGIEPEDFNDKNYAGLLPMSKEFVQQNRSNINKALKNNLPSELAAKIEIGSQAETSEHRGANQRYFVNAVANDIQININA